MRSRESACHPSVNERNRQRSKTLGYHGRVEINGDGDRVRKLADVHLGGDLLCRRRADKDVVAGIVDGLASRERERRLAEQPPK
jgi:hypothetical protein